MKWLIYLLGSVQCNFIFRAQELDLGRLATAFALLKLPGMPELAHQRTLPNFTPSSVDTNTIKVGPYPSVHCRYVLTWCLELFPPAWCPHSGKLLILIGQFQQ